MADDLGPDQGSLINDLQGELQEQRDVQGDSSPPLLKVEALSVYSASPSAAPPLVIKPPMMSPVIMKSVIMKSARRWLTPRSAPSTLILSNVSFSIAAGEVMMVAGHSGSGKSTLLRAVAGLTPAESGVVSLRGEHVQRGAESRELTLKRFGVMSQSAPLIPHLTVAENIEFGLTTTGTTFKGRDALSRNARVHDLLALLELETLAHRRPDTLSGGQRRRVALAQTLAPPRELYLLDEPLTNLEPALKLRLAERVIAEIKSLGGAALWASHELDLGLRYADQLAVIADQTISAIAPPQALFERPPNLEVARLFNVISWRSISSRLDGRGMMKIGFHKHMWSLGSQIEMSEESTSMSALVSSSLDTLEMEYRGAFDAMLSVITPMDHDRFTMTPLMSPLVFQVDMLKTRPMGNRVEFTFQVALGDALKSMREPLILSVDIGTCNSSSPEAGSLLMYSGAIFWSYEVGSQ